MLAFLSPRRNSYEYEMSFPSFPQYDYSAESTPNAYNWIDLEDHLASTTSPPGEATSISPPALQQPIQALPHSPAEHPQPQQHQPQPQIQDTHQIQAVFEPPQTTFIEDRFQPSQYQFNIIDESHFQPQQGGSHVGRPETGATNSRRPPLRVEVDDVRPAGRSTSESASLAGPSRVPHGKPHTQTSPYKRPDTSSGTRSVSASSSGQILRPSSTRQERVASEQHARHLHSSEREPLRPQLRASVAGVGSMHPAPMPAVGVGAASVSCPAYSVWRVNQSPSTQQNQIQSNTSGASPADLAPTAVTYRCAHHFVFSSLGGGSSCRPALVFLDRAAPPRSRCRHLHPSTRQ